MSLLKVPLGVGVALIVVGLLLIPLPGPGLIFLTGGVIVVAAAVVQLRKGAERRSRVEHSPEAINRDE